MQPEDYMRAAVNKARAGIEAGQTPFGAVVARQGRIVCSAHNTVWNDTDPTAHAEVNAIRLAAAQLATIDLSGCDMYTTCEPCPMCLSAIHWSKIDRVYFGATIADAAAAGFSELDVPAAQLAEMGGSHLRVFPGLLTDTCRQLFDFWKQSRDARRY